MSRKKSGWGNFLVGAGIGVALGILFAPKAGSETRRELKIKLDELVAKVKEIDPEEIKDYVLNKIENIKEDLSDLDREKVLRIAKEKALKIQEHVEELWEVVVEKGTPVLEKSVKAIREKAADVTREVLAKLEEN